MHLLEVLDWPLPFSLNASPSSIHIPSTRPARGSHIPPAAAECKATNLQPHIIYIMSLHQIGMCGKGGCLLLPSSFVLSWWPFRPTPIVSTEQTSLFLQLATFCPVARGQPTTELPWHVCVCLGWGEVRNVEAHPSPPGTPLSPARTSRLVGNSQF